MMLVGMIAVISVILFFMFFKIHLTSLVTDVDSINRYQEIPTTILSSHVLVGDAEAYPPDELGRDRRPKEKINCFEGDGPAGKHSPDSELCRKRLSLFFSKESNGLGLPIMDDYSDSVGYGIDDFKKDLRLALPTRCFSVALSKLQKASDSDDTFLDEGDAGCNMKSPKINQKSPIPVMTGAEPSVLYNILEIGSNPTSGDAVLVTWPRYDVRFNSGPANQVEIETSPVTPSTGNGAGSSDSVAGNSGAPKPPGSEVTSPDVPAEDSYTIRAVMLQFGDYMTEGEMNDFKSFLEAAFEDSTSGNVKLSIEKVSSVALPTSPPTKYNYGKARAKYSWISPDSEDRLWYYEYGKDLLTPDITAAASKAGFDSSRHDVAIVLSEAQFEDIGIFTNRDGIPLVITEQPTEVAFGSSSGYRTDRNSNYQLADEIIHELGHFMGLGHQCSQCAPPGGVLIESCCNACGWKDDPTSYCRIRPGGSGGSFYNKFTSCSLEHITEKSIPAMQQRIQAPQQTVTCNAVLVR